MARPQKRIRLAYVPAGVIYTVVVWVEQGPLVAMGSVAAGLALAFWLNHRAAVRRRHTEYTPESN